MSFLKKAAVAAAIAGVTLSLTACQSNEIKQEMVKAPELNNQDLYDVDHDGRHYVFDDFAV